MIRIITNTLIILFLTSFFICCRKKGEDDPLISFRSRKNRLAGDWVITSGSISSQTVTSSYTYDHLSEFTSTSYTSYNTTTLKNGSTSTRGDEGLLKYTLSFKKNGDFRLEKHTEGLVYVNGIHNSGEQNINTTLIEGTWNFTGNIGSNKKKDAVVISVGSITQNGVITTITGNKVYYTYYLKELTNNKLVLKRENSETKDSQAYTFAENLVFSAK